MRTFDCRQPKTSGRSTMAKILFTAVVADARGKLAGTVFSKNRAGAFMRTKVSPTNRRTPAQAAARATLSTLSAGWRGLTEEQRASWNAKASTSQGTNVFGGAKSKSGQQMYIGVNTNLLSLGLATVSTATESRAPSYTGQPRVESSVLNGAMSIFDIYFNTVTGPDTNFLIDATEPLSAGIDNADGKYRSLGILGVPGATRDSLPAYTAKFGTALAGQKIFVRLTPVSKTTGQASAPIILSFLVGGNSQLLALRSAVVEADIDDSADDSDINQSADNSGNPTGAKSRRK